MNVQDRSFSLRTTDEFLRWNEGREGRREFVGGRIVEMMVGVSRNHGKLAMKLGALLLDGIDPFAFDVASADFGVRTSAGLRYPDLVVDAAAGGEARDLAARAPVFVAEILSPSSLAVDFGEKAEEYTAIPSLLHYLVLSQDEPRIWLWTRGEAGFGKPEMIAGPDENVPLSGFGLTLALADLYRGIA